MALFQEEPNNTVQATNSSTLLPNFTDVSAGSDSVTIYKAPTTAIIKFLKSVQPRHTAGEEFISCDVPSGP